jgi:hypothetical protein
MSALISRSAATRVLRIANKKGRVDMAEVEAATEIRVAKKFRLTRKIGQGSFGDIFLGKLEDVVSPSKYQSHL